MTNDPHRAALIDQLPLPYATALRLLDSGVADEVIAQRVGVDPEVLPVFLRLAAAKLATATSDDP